MADEPAADTKEITHSWVAETDAAFANERELDETKRIEPVLDGAARAGERLLDEQPHTDVQVVRSAALLWSLVDRPGVSASETVRRSAIVLLADPAEPGTPHRCARCGRAHRLWPEDADWLSAGREDVLCVECGQQVAAEVQRAEYLARMGASMGRGRWHSRLRAMSARPAIEPAPVKRRPPRRPRLTAPAKLPAGASSDSDD